MDESFDYVIVGAGSAGCVLASRLSESEDCRVLLLEAGGSDHRLWTRVPLGIGKLVNDPTCTWAAETGPEVHLGGRRLAWASGRILGGGSSVNGMLAVRGDPRRYDLWQAEGASGMGYDEMLPYMRKLENCAFSTSSVRGRDGPINISIVEPDPLGRSFIEACGAIGLPRLDDYNAAFGVGTAPFQSSIGRGKRSSASVAYLRPAMRRRNLKVVTNAVAQRIVFSKSRAVGVEYSTGSSLVRTGAAREVIVCAGAIRSPQLLELSGIGQANVLRGLSIPVIQHTPAVGENLQDHYMVRLGFRCTEPITIYDFLQSRHQQAVHALNYITRRRGMFACGSLTALAFVSTGSKPGWVDARLQLGLASGTQRVSKGTESGLDPFSAFHIGGYFLYPESRGSIHVRERDARVSPSIKANYLAEGVDRLATLEVIKFLRAIAQEPALRRYVVEEIRPGTSVQNDKELLSYATATGDTCWHPIGTCKMGAASDGVVDAEFRVHGVEGLRVADASVFRFQVSSNTNIPTIALAERAADIIRRAH